MDSYRPVIDDVKYYLGIPLEDSSFNETLISFIEEAFLNVVEIGYGIMQETSIGITSNISWRDLFGELFNNDNDQKKKAIYIAKYVRRYICISVKLEFDPPESSSTIKILQDKKEEMLYKINRYMDTTEWDEV